MRIGWKACTNAVGVAATLTSAACAVEIGHLKEQAGEAIYQPAREADVLANVRAANAGPLDQVSKPALAVLEMDRAQIVAVVVHEVEGPQHQVVLDSLMHLSVERFEALNMDKLGIDDGGSAG